MEPEERYNNKELAAERLATASFVLGLLSLVSILCCCPFVLSAIGIVLALLSKGAEKQFRPRARTGFILSLVGMGVSVVLIAFTIIFPIAMYQTNPEFRKNFDNAMVQSLEQDEELFRQIYGDEAYEQVRDMFENRNGQ